MILSGGNRRPDDWNTLVSGLKHRWLLPLRAFEWLWEWAAYALSKWSFLQVLEYLGRLSVLVGVIFYFSESGDRVKLRHYQAWQVINTAQGQGGSGGRIEALQELNADRVPLVGVNASGAFLQGIRLERANLLRADLSAADLRNSDFTRCNFTLAELKSANFRGATLDHANLSEADLSGADLVGSNVAGADFTGAVLDDADLRWANLNAIRWRQLKSINAANIAGVRSAPQGFVEWALKNGAVDQPNAPQ